jgi:hypothetical protein
MFSHSLLETKSRLGLILIASAVTGATACAAEVATNETEVNGVPEGLVAIDPDAIITDDMPEDLKEHIRSRPYLMEATPIAEEAGVEYKALVPRFVVHTGDVSGAGTDAFVYVFVKTERGWEPHDPATLNSGWNLNKANYDDFERNATDTYTLSGLQQVGNTPSAVRIGQDGTGSNSRWNVASVKVDSLVNGSIVQKTCNFNPSWVEDGTSNQAFCN